MLVNKAKKRANKWLSSLAIALVLSFVGSVYAAGTSTASISPGTSTATGGTVTATGSSGNFEVSAYSTTGSFYIQGYGYKVISWWPDSTVANATAYSGQTIPKTFVSESGSQYYAQANAQPGASNLSGSAKLKVN